MNKTKEDVKLLIIFLKELVNKENIWALIAVLVLTILRSLIILIPSYYIMNILDVAIPDGNLKQVILFAVLALAFTILDSISETILAYANTSLCKTVYLNYQKRCIKHLFSLSGDYYSNIQTGELLMILNEDITRVKDIFSSVVLGFFSQLITSMVMLLFLARLQFDLLLIVLFILPLIFISQRYFQKKVKEKYQILRELSSELLSALESIVSNITQCIILKNNSFFEDRVDRIAVHTTDKEVKVSVWNSINVGSVNFLANVIIILVLGVGGYKVAAHKMTLGILMMFYMNLGKLVSPVLRLSGVFMQVQMMLVSIRKIHKFLETKPTIKLASPEATQDILFNENSIIFENVKFSYDDKKLFQNLSFEIHGNSFNALVGASGSGKSTIASLLYRFWDCENGKILLSRENIQKYDIAYLRESITIISQDVYIFDDTIYNNIVVGRKDITLEQVKKACEHAQIATYIEGLPEKYDTVVGEKGVKLSGGERQRISIARCLLNRNAYIYIFDEATSALDQLTERIIIQNLREYLKEKIIIFITHRIAAISEADRIYVIRKGAIIEEGLHSELLENHGYYHELNVSKSVNK